MKSTLEIDSADAQQRSTLQQQIVQHRGVERRIQDSEQNRLEANHLTAESNSMDKAIETL